MKMSKVLHCSRCDCREYPQWSLRVSRIIFYDKRCQIIYIIGLKENAEKLTLDEVVDLLPPPASRGVQLEGPQEVGCVAEVGADGHDLVDEVLDADDAVAPELLLDQVVGGDGSPLAVNLRR